MSGRINTPAPTELYPMITHQKLNPVWSLFLSPTWFCFPWAWQSSLLYIPLVNWVRPIFINFFLYLGSTMVQYGFIPENIPIPFQSLNQPLNLLTLPCFNTSRCYLFFFISWNSKYYFKQTSIIFSPKHCQIITVMLPIHIIYALT